MGGMNIVINRESTLSIWLWVMAHTEIGRPVDLPDLPGVGRTRGPWWTARWTFLNDPSPDLKKLFNLNGESMGSY